jgi:3-dehydroquinate synthetase
MVAELEHGRARGLVDDDVCRRTRSLLEALGLATAAPRGELGASVSYLEVDKKRRKNEVALPLATSVGEGKVLKVGVAELAGTMRTL